MKQHRTPLTDNVWSEQTTMNSKHNSIHPAFFQNLVEHSDVGIFTLKNGLIEYSNQAFSNIFGFPIEELRGLPLLGFVSDTNEKNFVRELEYLQKGKIQSINNYLNFTRKDGSIRHCSIQLAPCGEGLFSGALRDVTHKEKSRQLLENARSSYASLFQNILEGIIVYNYNTEEIVHLNDTALDILGFESHDEFCQKNRFDLIPQFSDFVPGVDLHEITQNHGEKVRNGESFQLNGVFKRKDGEEVFCRVSVVPTHMREGEGFVIFHDITKRVRSSKALVESEKKYRDIFENAHEAIVYYDLNEHRQIDCNSAALRLFRYDKKEEFLTFDLHYISAEMTEDPVETKKKFDHVVKTAIEKGKAKYQFLAKKADGETFMAEGIAVADLSEPKQPKLITFTRDITEMYEAGKKLEDRNTELQKYIDSNMQLENFAYFASHDMRTPIRSIISFTQMLKKSLNGKLNENESDYMDFIVSSAHNMKDLIDDLLLYSRVNTKEIELSPVDLPKLLNDIHSDMVSALDETGGIIKIDKIPKHIIADPTRIRQLFQNIISNGLKFKRPGVKPMVSVKGVLKKGKYHFTVKDNGIGIEPEYQEKIFLMFKRLHSSQDFEGTGIGLALCKKIVEQHEGKIWVESGKGKGTKFHFTLAKRITEK